ncbi:MAG: hypothetical protein J07HQW1_02835 [Haloquadratum walsbyi J07HQW1]|jgi:hypothetical protein|uniref:Uncharacterized protein n=1 Tax=Haloquadratum walsbyi J07HQW1 TaxID=1238424 RepID=U1PGN6_9EURY|nr:MAG: hypothetical protein J07HQW1_02835 [Haloquadratum walsbyi J07HQW1]
MIQTQIGEVIVGAYLRVINDCELVSYNQRSKEAGRQMELDVLGVKSTNGKQTVYACGVVTHIRGSLYSGSPDEEGWWSKYGNTSYQHSLECIFHKFEEDYDLVTSVFDDAEEYKFHFWSPYVSEGHLTDGLEEMTQQFENDYDESIELIINGEYTKRVRELRERASENKNGYDELAFRFFQILEHMREG